MELNPKQFGTATFRHPWRSYQERVLQSLATHLDDQTLHVVAPPGSGKTVLGLEVARRLGQPTLVLTPTLTIREQWILRLCEDFFPGQPPPPGISRQLSEMGWFTAATYQSLAAEAQRDLPALIDRLITARVSTLVVDEAHHLRNVWWRNLERLRAGLDARKQNLTLVALTATPPFDVSSAEWSRYLSFCGPIDEEIGVPELVQSRDLCPHQDFVFLTSPSETDREPTLEFRRRVLDLVQDLSLDIELADGLAADPRVRHPEQHHQELLDHHEFYLAVAIFLSGLKWEKALPLLHELDLRDVSLPSFDHRWAEALLQGILFADRSTESLGTKVRDLRQRLSSAGAIERRRVRLINQPGLERRLRRSATKIPAVCQIVHHETKEDPWSRRVVILADHIHREALTHSPEVGAPVPKLGVVPLFEALRQRRIPGVELGVLTGTLVLFPKTLLGRIEQDLGQEDRKLRVSALPHDPAYLQLEITDRIRQSVVQVVTRRFEEGHLNVLVGTAALLGEGWDAPSIDTLILATSIGSFVRSNQMRGRAIRRNPKVPSKVSVIWHLACVEVDSTNETSLPAPDLIALGRRFSSFVGLRLGQPTIECGLHRLGIDPQGGFTTETLETKLTEMLRSSEARDQLFSLWQRSVAGDQPIHNRLVQSVEVPPRTIHPKAFLKINSSLTERLLNRWYRWRAYHRIRQIALTLSDLMAAEHPSPLPRPKIIQSSRGFSVALRGAPSSNPVFVRRETPRGV